MGGMTPPGFGHKTDEAVSVADGAMRGLSLNPDRLASDDAGIDLLPGGAQLFTAAWVDVGPEIALHGYNAIKLWLTVDFSDSAGFRFRLLEKHESAGVEEYIPVEIAVTGGVRLATQSYWELATNADQLVTLAYDTDGATPYLQLQIQVGTIGLGTAQLDSAYYTRGWK